MDLLASSLDTRHQSPGIWAPGAAFPPHWRSCAHVCHAKGILTICLIYSANIFVLFSVPVRGRSMSSDGQAFELKASMWKLKSLLKTWKRWEGTHRRWVWVTDTQRQNRGFPHNAFLGSTLTCARTRNRGDILPWRHHRENLSLGEAEAGAVCLL